MHKAGYTVTISAGNSNVVFGVFAGDTYLNKWRIETRSGRSADEYGAWILSIFEHVDINPSFISGAIISCVVPSIELVLISMCRRFFNVEPVVVIPGIKTGVKINYGQAGDLGPDRVANIVAMAQKYEGPAMVVDFGTTTSFDVIDANNTYLGGAVAPGVSLSLESLSRAAPQLPEVGLIKPDKVIGKNIVHSIQSGCFWGAVDMVEGLTKRIWNELGIKGACIATGGFAKEMAEGIQIFDDVDTNLTLSGLKLIYDQQTKRK